MLFAGFVLWQQGSSPSVQPMENDKWIVLLNGDIFNADKDQELSDSQWLLEKLSSCENEKALEIFKTIEGPFSVIFYNKETKDVFFGRDSLGRNSLLIQKTEYEIIISSTLGKYGRDSHKTVKRMLHFRSTRLVSNLFGNSTSWYLQFS